MLKKIGNVTFNILETGSVPFAPAEAATIGALIDSINSTPIYSTNALYSTAKAVSIVKSAVPGDFHATYILGTGTIYINMAAL